MLPTNVLGPKLLNLLLHVNFFLGQSILPLRSVLLAYLCKYLDKSFQLGRFCTLVETMFSFYRLSVTSIVSSKDKFPVLIL